MNKFFHSYCLPASMGILISLSSFANHERGLSESSASMKESKMKRTTEKQQTVKNSITSESSK